MKRQSIIYMDGIHDAGDTDLLYTMFTQWKRLHGLNKPETPIDIMIDKATGKEDQLMAEFSEWFVTDILPRLRESYD